MASPTFLCPQQVQASLRRLSRLHPFFGTSFLAFKKAQLPVGRTTQVIFSRIAAALLMDHYRASSSYEGFYNPFHSSKGASAAAWVAPRYPSTSLQRITTDTFSDALIHPKSSSDWGWKKNYIVMLKGHLDRGKIPAFDLAVWLYRDAEWPAELAPSAVRDRLFAEFSITATEKVELFNVSIPKLVPQWHKPTRITESELLSILGPLPVPQYPPGRPETRRGTAPETQERVTGAALKTLELHHVGPTRHLRYEPASRLNLLTGDNALGKTFLLECVFWSLTEEWVGRPAMPPFAPPEPADDEPSIVGEIIVESDPDGRSPDKTVSFRSDYRRDEQSWSPIEGRTSEPGVVIYGRCDGSFAVWDSVKPPGQARHRSSERTIFLTSEEIWRGKEGEHHSQVIGGLISDWLSWYRGGDEFAVARRALDECVRQLSPDPDNPLRFGSPMFFPGDERQYPTLDMPYDREVPVTIASAGVKRMLAIAYVLVWALTRHLRNSGAIQKAAVPRVILLVDEVEAHLHPRWQRRLVPALIAALKGINTDAVPQLHVATHSPFVLASAEEAFDEVRDGLFHLTLSDDGTTVDLEVLDFHKYGRMDRWVTSEAIGLASSRGLAAEKAIEMANAIQAKKTPADSTRVLDIHQQLAKTLGSDDDYWMRWLGFARQHGVNV